MIESKEQRKSWPEGLRAGDRVAVRAGGVCDREWDLLTISRRTPSGLLRFHERTGVYDAGRDRWQRRGGRRSYEGIHRITPDIEEQLRRQAALRSLTTVSRAQIEALPTENLVAAAKALRVLE